MVGSGRLRSSRIDCCSPVFELHSVMALRSHKDSFHTTYRPTNYGAQYFRLQPHVARMFCTGDDDSKDVILESSNSMNVLYSSSLRPFERFRKLSTFRG